MIRLRLEELAKARGMSQSLLQRSSGVTIPMLRRYWVNDTDSWHKESLVKLARALGVRVADLIEEIPERQEEALMEDMYRETSEAADTFFIDTLDQSVVPVIEEIGGSVSFDETIRRIDGHMGRYRVQLPAGCTYVGRTAGLHPQTIILPESPRRLCVIPGQVSVDLQFLAGESSDPSLWNGAQRIPDKEEEGINQ